MSTIEHWPVPAGTFWIIYQYNDPETDKTVEMRVTDIDNVPLAFDAWENADAFIAELSHRDTEGMAYVSFTILKEGGIECVRKPSCSPPAHHPHCTR